MTGRIFEDPGLGKILTSSKDEIQKSLKLRQLDYTDSFFFFFNKNGIKWNYTMNFYPLERKFQTCRSLDVTTWWQVLLIKNQIRVFIYFISQLFHLQMKATMLTTYIFYCSIKMWMLLFKWVSFILLPTTQHIFLFH